MVKKMKRTRRQRGGATPYYSFGSAVAPGAPYASEVLVHDSPNVPRPGMLTSAGAGTGGLPGFTGGGKRRGLLNYRRYLNYGRKALNYSRKSAKRVWNYGRKTTRKVLGRFYRGGQRGGRYTLDVASAVGGPNVFVPVSRIGCEGGLVNTAPAGALPNPTPMRGGAACRGKRCWSRRGGRRRQSGGVGGIDSAAYYAPTAGYGNQASTWVSSTGTPSMLQIPYDARAANPACLKTA
jgi:hypothetical protein